MNNQLEIHREKSYGAKQKALYTQCIAVGQKESALDALWRASSNEDLLLDEEISHHQLTPERIAELLFMLDWQDP